MTDLRKKPTSPSLQGVAAWAPTTDLVRLDQIVRTALDDPRHAARQLAAWHVRASKASLPVRLTMMAILAGTLTRMGDDQTTPSAAGQDG
jgi:hypothetical protein